MTFHTLNYTACICANDNIQNSKNIFPQIIKKIVFSTKKTQALESNNQQVIRVMLMTDRLEWLTHELLAIFSLVVHGSVRQKAKAAQLLTGTRGRHMLFLSQNLFMELSCCDGVRCLVAEEPD